jgi:NAD(P)-dependent dehydrogenase (short-subunit alcohol dehydrogenase family)
VLKNNVVAITGGAGKIGTAFSKAIVENGGKVIIGDISVDKGKELQDDLGVDSALFIELNTTDVGSIDKFLKEGREHFGKIDSAVHCAYPRSKQWGSSFEKIEAEGLKEDLFHQLGGAILFSQRVISYFKKQGYGNLVHVASIQGVAAPKFEHYDGTSMVSPIEYSAIKSGIISITRYLARYCSGQSIRVNCISPGGILDNQPASFLEKYNASCSSKGMMDAPDLNGAIIFLLSEMSQYINGQNVIIDDGWTL